MRKRDAERQSAARVVLLSPDLNAIIHISFLCSISCVYSVSFPYRFPTRIKVLLSRQLHVSITDPHPWMPCRQWGTRRGVCAGPVPGGWAGVVRGHGVRGADWPVRGVAGQGTSSDRRVANGEGAGMGSGAGGVVSRKVGCGT